MYQLVDSFTRITKQYLTKIDLILTNNKDLKPKTLNIPKITDHYIIDVYLADEQNKESKILKQNLQKYGYNKIST